ncbi:MAG: type II secretion system protein GspE [Armatimonadetes bacterium CG_4_10_14_3_um_filter_66_18]|nr:type II/IV secretion system protein [Armatimonadota bacterium]OIP09859.1 MAG: hypothetical protein AUJ96_04485 [Armatimonadetes bacterium CG2_30_66_41]PIY44724.1 MAG: type II secretion system protein GspE [Armatimonadetes bacterium CG_4_10_14_3_um_filter_66_18]PIZ42966.1 MAG: type II secretion system protein GspE [Armatimonadetes bacterium CG_4_10_14_0_8_um_filter_66_14]PJB60383.1 MAG: type II secretion system protein GspE [Armatimonadetes bacterium CG_4_9_14_3_um_filter_66_14]
MEGVLESAQTFHWRRLRLHVGAETLVMDRRVPLSQRATVEGVRSYDEVEEALVKGSGRRVTLQVRLTNGHPDWEFPGVPRAEAEWAAGLIAGRLATRQRAAAAGFTGALPLASLQREADTILAGDTRQVVDLVDFILVQATHRGASDVHFEPFRAESRVRYRVDGVLHEALVLPLNVQEAVLNRLKVVSNLKVFETGLPQEGRIVARTGGRSVDLRVTALPTIHGEKVTVRLFDPQRGMLALGELGMSEETLRAWRGLVDQPQGALLLTGPSNSGKTTTMYASLLHLHEERRSLSSIATVEDPVEYDLSVINQTQTNPDIGLTFAAGLRSLLRQDPEILMIGEIRDAETADIAVGAGLTGHLIFSTVHAKTPAAVFLRLIEMGVEPFLVASSVTAVLAQRLVRVNCPECVGAYDPSEEALARFGADRPTDVNWQRGVGCDNCGGTGYSGRTGLYQLVPVSDSLRDLILSRSPERDLTGAMQEAGVKTLLDDGLAKAAAGVTTAEELLRVLGSLQ